MSRVMLLSIGLGLAGLHGSATPAAEVALLDTPKVTAILDVRDEGGFAAQIGVHDGPIAQLPAAADYRDYNAAQNLLLL